MTGQTRCTSLYQSPKFTVIKAGSTLISVSEVTEPYLGDPNEVARGVKNKILATAWSEHCAWAAFDFMNRDVPKEQAFRALASLVAEMLDIRCAGIYLPGENRFTMEGDGSAARHLRHLAG